jgi:hypothetical protein
MRNILKKVLLLSNQNIYLLDQISGAIGAYSLRKLKRAAVNCIRVRRSSDNTEKDIIFVGINLDITDLLSFVGSSNGYITKWYDQSGNSKDLAQSTAANQPLIINSGSLVTIDGTNAGMSFNGSPQTLSNENPFPKDIFSIFLNFKTPSSFTSGNVYLGNAINGTTDGWRVDAAGSNMRMQVHNSGTPTVYGASGTGLSTNTAYKNTITYNGAAMGFYYNGVSQTTSSSSDGNLGADNGIYIARRGDGGAGNAITLREFIFFNRVLSSGEINLL